MNNDTIAAKIDAFETRLFNLEFEVRVLHAWIEKVTHLSGELGAMSLEELRYWLNKREAQA